MFISGELNYKLRPPTNKLIGVAYKLRVWGYKLCEFNLHCELDASIVSLGMVKSGVHQNMAGIHADGSAVRRPGSQERQDVADRLHCGAQGAFRAFAGAREGGRE